MGLLSGVQGGIGGEGDGGGREASLRLWSAGCLPCALSFFAPRIALTERASQVFERGSLTDLCA